jgi:WD40 repeat protein
MIPCTKLVKVPDLLPAPVPTTTISFAVTASRDKTVKIWDAIRGHCLYTLVGHDDWVRAIVFHPNGQYLLTASDDHTFRTWDLKTGRNTKKVEAHEKFVTSMSWGRQAMTASSTDATDPNAPPRLVNVIATSSSDQVCLRSLLSLYSSLTLVIIVGQNMASPTMNATNVILFYIFILFFSLSADDRYSHA